MFLGGLHNLEKALPPALTSVASYQWIAHTHSSLGLCDPPQSNCVTPLIFSLLPQSSTSLFAPLFLSIFPQHSLILSFLTQHALPLFLSVLYLSPTSLLISPIRSSKEQGNLQDFPNTDITQDTSPLPMQSLSRRSYSWVFVGSSVQGNICLFVLWKCMNALFFKKMIHVFKY